MPAEWELRGFGPCIADWIATQPPSEWRKPVNRWVRGLRSDPFRGAERESALDRPGWSGWFAEIPDVGNTLVAVVAYYGISEVEPVVRCLAIESLPRNRG